MARDELGSTGGKVQPSYATNTAASDYRHGDTEEQKLTDEEINKEVNSLLDEIP